MLRTLSFATVTLALGVLAAPVSAAPSVNLKGAVLEPGTSLVEKVHSVRRCWWHRGHRHCRYVRGYRAYGHAPNYYYGYGPSFGLYFGGGGHRHWRRHHRHW